MFYSLNELNNIVPCSMNQVANFKTGLTKKLARDMFGEIIVSTVFLGVEHGHDAYGNPILFETMIFNGQHDEYMERYTSYAAALVGHVRAVNKVKRELGIDDTIKKVVIHDPIGRKGICLRS